MVSPLLLVNWKEHSNILSTVCKDLFDNFFVDCTIVAENQSLKAHRLILSACSPYFQMLFSEEREKHPILILKDVSFEALKNVIDFVYRGEIQIPEGDLKAFLELAESLQIKGLDDPSMKDGCEPFTCDASRDVCQGPSSDNQKDTFGVRSTSASHDRTESSFEQPPLYHSYGFPGTVQKNSSPSFEESNKSLEKEKSILEKALSQQKNAPVLPSEKYKDTEIKVKQGSVCVVVKCEQIDECDELMQEDNTEDTEESCLFQVSKSFICDANRDMHQVTSCDDTFQVQSTSVRPNSTESSSEQPFHSDRCTVTVQTNSSLASEECNIPCKKKESLLEMALSQQHSKPMLPGMSHLDTETTLKEEPLQLEGVFVKSEQLDECDELMQEDNADDIDEWEPPIFAEQNLDQYSSIASTHMESSNELLDAVRMPLIIGPSNAQGAAEPPRDEDIRNVQPATDTPAFLSPRQMQAPPQPDEPQPLSHSASTSSSSAADHKRKHTGERPHRCNLCGKAYHKKGGLVVHQRSHTGERPYSCDVCGNSFDSSSKLVVHKRRHTGERPYACDVCGMAFAQIGTLTTHKRRHTGERPFCCDLCGKSFVQSPHLSLHLRRHHAQDRS